VDLNTAALLDMPRLAVLLCPLITFPLHCDEVHGIHIHYSTLRIYYCDLSRNEGWVGSDHSIEATEAEIEVGREQCRALLKMSFST
jgi:hypothetical protein